MSYAEWMRSAEALVKAKLAEVGHENVSVSIEWAEKFISTGGTGKVTSHPRKEGRIRLSKPLWPKATEADRTETVVHELAHVLDFLARGPETPRQVFIGDRWRWQRRDIHGPSWKAWMRVLGYPNPSRTHKIASQEIAARRRRKRAAKVGGNGWRVPCERCQQDVRMGPRQYSTARKGRRVYTHTGCGGSMDLVSARPI